MYRLPEYAAPDGEEVFRFMKAHPFATLIGAEGGRAAATQVPLIFREDGERLYLQAHIMKGTDHYRVFQGGAEALLLFTSPSAYVSASNYTNTRQGSTWNYMTVQVRGPLRFMSEEETVDLLRRTTEHFEGGPQTPASFDQLPDDYVPRLVKAIAGFEVEARQISHVFKLSQDKDEESRSKVISALEAGEPGQKFIAEEMKKVGSRKSAARSKGDHQDG